MILQRQVNAKSISYTKTAIADSIPIVVKEDKFFMQTPSLSDDSLQKDQLEKDLLYLKGFLASVEKKLGNQRFVDQAKPEIIEAERKKKADAEAKIKVIEESLSQL